MVYLEKLGWTAFQEKYWQSSRIPGRVPARIVEEQRSVYRVWDEVGERRADISGHLRQENAGMGLPAVGDWVEIEPLPLDRAIIHRILPRTSCFSRKAAGSGISEQVIAANIDTVMIVTSANEDLNPRRLERYITQVWESGALPVVLLSKTDLCSNIEEVLPRAIQAAAGVPVHPVSVLGGTGLTSLEDYLKPGKTVALLGSSGVGKSTLVNHLLDREIQKVDGIRERDGRGRHTTTYRRLFMIEGGGLIIDTPGMRELQLWSSGGGEALSRTFEDIVQLSAACRFRDCRHLSEPDCAVIKAVAEGSLSAERYDSFMKLDKELAYLHRKQNLHARLEEAKRWRRIHKEQRRLNKKHETD